MTEQTSYSESPDDSCAAADGRPGRLSVIGAGKLGRVLAACLQRSGACRPGQILNRSQASGEAAARFIGNGSVVSDWSALRPAELWMLAVPDDQISAASARLAASGLLRAHDIVFHCSGATASAALQDCAAAGAETASLHPVRSFADPARVAADFAGTICSLEGSPVALAVLQRALELCGAQVVQIRAEAKLVYHAASVFACNYLVTLMDTAMRAYQEAGISAAMAAKMAQPLAQQTLQNVFNNGCIAALTGPIARGDHQLVAQQLAAVQDWDQAAGALYQAMIPLTEQLAAAQAHSEK